MSTWHQDQVRTKLYHKTKWSVVVDPPNGLRCIVLCNNRAQAEKIQSKNPHSYVLKPESEA